MAAWARGRAGSFGPVGATRLLQLAASVAAGVPVDLGQALADFDHVQLEGPLAALALITPDPAQATTAAEDPAPC
ncbi:hypothetical protein ACTG9Q_31630 [Actinokineospora sp. 24-640]